METMNADNVILAEAAAWIARLQGSQRTPAAEAAFREWLQADAAHRQAFARASDVWEVIPGAAGFAERTRPLPQPRRRTPLSLAACVAALLVALGFFYIERAPRYTTSVGQQRNLTLSDGTRVSLNTDSLLFVDYSSAERRVRLERGEALFEVAKELARPFIVQAGTEQVRALGTAFVVRKELSTVAVTLIEGRVEVTPRVTTFPQGRVFLAPGERVTLRASAPAARDRPRVEAVTAWRHGEVMFDDVSLLDAATEINRYGERHLVIAESALAQLRVSGVFETRDPREFAHAMAQLHRLTVEDKDAEIVLRR